MKQIDIDQLRDADLVQCHCREDGKTYRLQGTALAQAVILATEEARKTGVEFVPPRVVILELEADTLADMTRIWLELRCRNEGEPMSDDELAMEHMRRRKKEGQQ